MNATYTVAEIATRYGMTPDQVIRRCQRNGWPHIRPNARKSSTWRFTAGDIQSIDNLMHHGAIVDSWGREVKAS